jgi:hypothetical protein
VRFVIRRQISITEEQQRALRRLAAARRVSQAAVVRDALDEVRSRDARSRRVARARAAIGTYRSGSSELGVEHDAALDDAFTA